MITFANDEIPFLFNGPNGLIEAITTQGNKNITVIICHPHPLHGGTMHNKVVTTMAKAFKELEFKTLRFNFRGVGKSAGVHDNGIGETDDVIFIANQITKLLPNETLFLAGFSFGGFVAARASFSLAPEYLITIAPQISRFVDLPAITIPWLLVQGENDEVISPADVFSWVEKIEPKPDVIRFSNTGHFFHGKLVELRHALVNYFHEVK